MTIKEVSEKYGITQDTLRYYERVGMIPPVERLPNGIRSYSEENLKWVELAKCMRSAGLSVETMAKYVKLSLQGDSTIPDRFVLLKEQRAELAEQQRRIEETIVRLDYKISRYESAMKTGVLSWEKDGEEQRT